jgi:Fe-S cluster assembly protein SufD
MIVNKEHMQQFVDHFNRFENSLNGQKEEAVHQLRIKGFEKFKALGFPTTKNEEWRFTNIEPLLKQAFELTEKSADEKVSEKDLEDIYFKNWNGPQIVFVNGYYSDKLSKNQALTNGLIIENLSSLLDTAQDPLLESFTGFEVYDENVFSALNTAFISDGIVIKVPQNTQSESPVNLIFLSTEHQTARVMHPRNLIYVEKNSALSVVESYFSTGSGVYFNNPVTELKIEENARLNHVRIQNENTNAYHVGNIFTDQDRNSVYHSTSVTFGGRISRNNYYARLNGEGIETTLNGLYLGHGKQLIDNHTFLDHAKPHCTSHEVYQGILTDKANAVFSGKIMVRQDAQKTDAKQSNNCLILSDDARINSKPQLEIYADDVRCTHGATVGQLNEDAVFYLQSRGIPEKKAKNILTYAYAERVIDGIDSGIIKSRIDELLQKRLEEDINFVK